MISRTSMPPLRAWEQWKTQNQARLVTLCDKVQVARHSARLETVNAGFIERASYVNRVVDSMDSLFRLMRIAPTQRPSPLSPYLIHGVHYILHIGDLIRSVTVDNRGHALWADASLQRSAIRVLRAIRMIVLSTKQGWTPHGILLSTIGARSQPIGDMFISLSVFFQQEEANRLSQTTEVLLPLTATLIGKEKLAKVFLYAVQWYLVATAKGTYTPPERHQEKLLLLYARLVSLEASVNAVRHACPSLSRILPRIEPACFSISLRSLANAIRSRAPDDGIRRKASPFERDYVVPFLRSRTSFLPMTAAPYVPASVRRHLAEIPWRNYSGDTLVALICCGFIATRRLRFRGNDADRGHDLDDFFCIWAKANTALQTKNVAHHALQSRHKSPFQLLTQDACALACFDRVVRQLLTVLGHTNIESFLPPNGDFQSSSPRAPLSLHTFHCATLATSRIVVPYQPVVCFNTVIQLISLFGSFASRSLRQWHALTHVSLTAVTYHHGFSFTEIELRPQRYVKTIRALMGLSASTAMAALPMLDRLREYVALHGPLPDSHVEVLLQAAVNGFSSFRLRLKDCAEAMEYASFFLFVEAVIAPVMLTRLTHHDKERRLRCLRGDATAEATSAAVLLHRRSWMNTIMSDRVRPEEGWKGVRRLFYFVARFGHQQTLRARDSNHKSKSKKGTLTTDAIRIVLLLSRVEEER